VALFACLRSCVSSHVFFFPNDEKKQGDGDDRSWIDSDDPGALRLQPEFAKGPVKRPKVEAVVPLWRRDWALRATAKNGMVALKAVTGDEFRECRNAELPESLKSAGVIWRPPGWEEMNPGNPANKPWYTRHFEPPRRRHTSEEYADLIVRICRALKGPSLRWAMFEFFYPDIEKGWFSHDDFAWSMAGSLPLGSRLTRSERTLVRQRFQRKPRRFSRKFISEQLLELEQYKNECRIVQRDHSEVSRVDQLSTTAMPQGHGLLLRFISTYEIPCIITAGSTVSAVHPVYRLLHRGTVLGFDHLTSRYTVLFERPECRSGAIADTEIALHGTNKLIWKPLCDGSTGAGGISTTLDTRFPCGSAAAGSEGKISSSRLKLFETTEISDSLKADSLQISFRSIRPDLNQDIRLGSNGRISSQKGLLETGKYSLAQISAEREMLVLLLCTVEQAIIRKKLILASAEKLAGLQSRTSDLDSHFQWVIENLNFVNAIIETSTEDIRILYGSLLSRYVSQNTTCQKFTWF
jgi:DIRP